MSRRLDLRAEYACRDCGAFVSAFSPPAPGIRCAGCQWVAGHKDPLDRPIMRGCLIACGVIRPMAQLMLEACA